ncbi:hypothetical protein Tco_0669136, partial [Tanacetum coccineum]
PILLSFTHCGNKSILRVLRIILVILPEHPSETKVFHNEDGNPARANIKQALGRSSKSSSGTIIFGNDQIEKIMGNGDYQLGNVTISRVYYVECLGHNLFFLGQFCDLDLEVAFWKHTCYIRNLECADLLSESRDTNLYTISLDDMLNTLNQLAKQVKETRLYSLWYLRISMTNLSMVVAICESEATRWSCVRTMLEGKIPSATSAADVAATWVVGPRWMTWALYWQLRGYGLGTRWQVRMAARKASWLARDTRTNKEASEMTRGGCWLVDAAGIRLLALPERVNDELIRSSVDDLVPILRETEVTLVCDDLECDMPITILLPTTNVREEDFDFNSLPGEQVVDFLIENEDVNGLPRHLVKQFFSHLVKHLSSTKRMSDEPLGDDSKRRSYDVTFSNPLFDFNDDYTLCYDNRFVMILE